MKSNVFSTKKSTFIASLALIASIGLMPVQTAYAGEAEAKVASKKIGKYFGKRTLGAVYLVGGVSVAAQACENVYEDEKAACVAGTYVETELKEAGEMLGATFTLMGEGLGSLGSWLKEQ